MTNKVESVILLDTCISIIEEFVIRTSNGDMRAYLKGRVVFFENVLRDFNLSDNQTIAHHYVELRSLIGSYLQAFRNEHRNECEAWVSYEAAAISALHDRLERLAAREALDA